MKIITATLAIISFIVILFLMFTEKVVPSIGTICLGIVSLGMSLSSTFNKK